MLHEITVKLDDDNYHKIVALARELNVTESVALLTLVHRVIRVLSE